MLMQRLFLNHCSTQMLNSVSLTRIPSAVHEIKEGSSTRRNLVPTRSAIGPGPNPASQ